MLGYNRKNKQMERKKNNLVFLTLFINFEKVHLTKDVGMIPYFLKMHGRYDVKIACYTDGKSFGGEEDIEIVKIKRRTGKELVDGILFLLEKAKSIDILQLYHVTTLWNFFWIFVYKWVNPKGKVYLKLDTGYGRFYEKQAWWQRIMLRKCDFVSAEIEDVAKLLSQKWKRKVIYIPNGINCRENKEIAYENKENIICMVARVGTCQKAVDVGMEIFRQFSEINDEWIMRIIGPIEEDFYEKIDTFFINYPYMKTRIFFTGEIQNRDEIEKEYQRAKVYFSSARWEAFSIALLEAISNGCFVVSTKVGGIDEVIQGDKYGYSFSVDNEQDGTDCLIRACQRSEDEAKRSCLEVQKYAREHYDWNKIVEELEREMD